MRQLLKSSECLNKGNDVEKLARLNSKVMSWSERVDGDPIGHLTADELSIALARVKGEDGPSVFIRAKYCNDAREARKLLALIGGSIITSHEVPLKYQTLMARLVLENALVPPLCPVCRGTKQVKIDSKVFTCNKCEGHGILSKTDLYMASFLNATKEEWTSYLEKEYCRVMSIVDRWEYLGRQALISTLIFE